MTEEIKKVLEEYKEHTDNKIEEVKRHFGVLKEDMDSKVALIGEQYSSIQENTEIIKNDIAIIKNAIKKKVDMDEFELLEKRVRILESKIK